jgi:hypothetical protein
MIRALIATKFLLFFDYFQQKKIYKYLKKKLKVIAF